MSNSSDAKEIENLPKKLKILFIVIVLLFVIGTIGFRIVSESSLENSFYRTVQTLAFIFEDDSEVSERVLEIFLSIFGVFLIWWVLWSVADILLEGNLGKYLKRRVYTKKLEKMENHVIIVGGGRVGEEVSKVLLSKDKSFLIIELNQKVASILKKKGYSVILGDALNEDVLKKANIDKASKIILSLPKTETNILLTLTAKELNQNIEVHSRCENNNLVAKLKRAGAQVVTVPEVVAANKIAKDLGV
jgi:voltage-gated potassium channel